MITIYYFDASIIAKLYLDENGSREARKIFNEASVRKTTSFCFAESLAALKCKLLKNNQVEKYLDSSLDLITTVKDDNLQIDEQSIFNREMLDEALNVVKENNKVDLLDVFQLLSIENSLYSENNMLCVFVTADGELAQLARKRGIKVKFINTKTSACCQPKD